MISDIRTFLMADEVLGKASIQAIRETKVADPLIIINISGDKPIQFSTGVGELIRASVVFNCYSKDFDAGPLGVEAMYYRLLKVFGNYNGTMGRMLVDSTTVDLATFGTDVSIPDNTVFTAIVEVGFTYYDIDPTGETA